MELYNKNKSKAYVIKLELHKHLCEGFRAVHEGKINTFE